MFGQLPLWAVFLVTIIVSLLAVEIGYRLGNKFGKDQQDGTAVSTMVQSILALLAFLLAFTFGIASERFNERREFIINEANSIGTTYLRADFLAPPARKEVQDLLREYVSWRQHPVANAEFLARGLDVAGKLQARIWSVAVANGRLDLNSDIGALFVESVNETIDLHSSRVAAGIYARVPETVWLALYLLMFLGLSSIGYQSGCARSRSIMTTTILVLSFAIVILLIADLDRPNEGFLQSNLQPMKDLAKKIGAPSAPRELQQFNGSH